MPLYVLDTDICVGWLRGSRRIKDKVQQAGAGVVTTTAMTVAELYYGACKSRHVEGAVAAVEEFCRPLQILDITPVVAARCGQMKAALERRGARLDDADLLIAATTLVHGGTLITGNLKHFRRIPDLIIESWSG